MGVEWRASLSVGIDEIDLQHKQLLENFNNLLSACKTGEGVDELRRLLLFLDEYVTRHFRDEEALQVKHSYPEYAGHKKEHDAFIQRLHALRQEIVSEGAGLHHVMETNTMLLKWLLNHISTVDVELGIFLRSAGGGIT